MDHDQIRHNVKLVVDKTRAQWLGSDDGSHGNGSNPSISLVGNAALPPVHRQETTGKAFQNMARAYGQHKR